MKRFPWAAAGVLVALTALPTLASAAGDGSADSLRTRGTDLLRRAAPAPTAPVVAPETDSAFDRLASKGTDSVLPPMAEPIPVTFEILPLAQDLALELGPVTDVPGLVFRDQPLVVGMSSTEIQARLRQEMAALVYFDLPVEQD